jgi:hypothetical protein
VPWRLGPRAASLALLGAGALIAAATGLRDSGTSTTSSASSAIVSDAATASIDRTLTLDDAGCARVDGTVWHPLSGVEYTGRLRVTLPAALGGALLLYVGDAVPPDLEASTMSGSVVPLHVERIVLGPGVLVPLDFWIEDGSPLLAPRHLSRVQIDASGTAPRIVRLSLGRRAPRVLARLAGYPTEERVQICADPLAPGELYFGAGWFGEERDAVEGRVRWMREHGAVMLSAGSGQGAEIRARLAPAVPPGESDSPELVLRVNDVWSVGPVPLRNGFQDFTWSVPDEAWVVGTNELFFTVSRTRSAPSRTLGLALASLHVR